MNIAYRQTRLTMITRFNHKIRGMLFCIILILCSCRQTRSDVEVSRSTSSDILHSVAQTPTDEVAISHRAEQALVGELAFEHFSELNMQAVFRVEVSIQHQEALFQGEKTQILATLDLPELRKDGALHFFEIKPETTQPNQSHSFLWKFDELAWVFGGTTRYGANLSFFVESPHYYRPPTIMTKQRREKSMDTSTIPMPWGDLADRCTRSCLIDVYIWKPQKDEFHVLEARGTFTGTKSRDSFTNYLYISDLS